MATFLETFEAAIPQLRTQILKAFGTTESNLGFRSRWENFEEVINPILTNFFVANPLNIPVQQIRTASSKSTYPDLKVEYEGHLYAFDVKSGEDTRDPWYDIGRMDTYEKNHLQKYAGEYSIVVKWTGRKKEDSKILNVFIEPTYRTVGLKKECNGTYYRPYDGKLRPKGWVHFENETYFWKDLEHFKQGLAASTIYRRRALIVEWYKAMSVVQRLEIKRDLATIDAGKQITLDNFEEDVEGNEE